MAPPTKQPESKMSANVESMAFTGSKPWHGLGVEVAGLMTAREAIVKAGLNWAVSVQKLFVEGALALDTGAQEMNEVPDFHAVVRQTDKKALGVVGGRYTPVQNDDAFSFFDAVVQDGGAKYETAGALNGGKRIWMLAKLEGDVTVRASKQLDDKIEKYVMLSNSHDGSGALRMFFTPVRVVCSNTEAMALKGAGKDGISIRHTASAAERMKEAARVVDAAGNYYKAFDEKVNTLGETAFSGAQMTELAEALFPSSKADGEVATRTNNNRTELVSLFAGGRGNFGATAWDAYNAVTEFADWSRGTRTSGGVSEQEQRFTSNLFGSGRLFKDKGLETINQILGM
jgi:phage/plasmid-like protein (TIGR03299 family)